MSDNGTMRDHIDDLMIERDALLKQTRQLQRQIDHLRKIADKAFTQAGGCIAGCRGACMCTCGYEHYRYIVSQEQKEQQ